MSLLYRKKIEKESNIARTPENKLPVDGFSKSKFYLLLWNILSMAFYCCYIFFIILQISYSDFLSKLIIWLVYIYIGAFALLLLLSIGSKKKLKARMTNYKSALNFLKYFIQLVNFVLSIVTALSAFLVTGKTDIKALSYAIMSLGLTVIMVAFEVFKIIIRKNIPVVKKNFFEIRDRKEEELIKLGKKKPKQEVVKIEEKKSQYEDDEDEVEDDFEENFDDDDDDNDVVIDFDEPEQGKDYYSRQFNKRRLTSFLARGTDNADQVGLKSQDKDDKNPKKKNMFGKIFKK